MPNATAVITFNAADYAVMSVYVLGLVGMGLYLRRSAQKDVDTYFLAGRRLPGWLTGVSYAATCMNTDVAPAYCGMTVICGLFVCWWYVSRFGLALMIGAVLFAVFWRRLHIFTSPEFYELRFTGRPAVIMRSWVSLRSAFVAVVAWTGAGLLGLQKVAQALFGWEEWQTYGLVVPVVLIYVLLSGYIGVVVTDLVQAVIMIAASVVLMASVLIDFGGPSGLLASLTEQFGPAVVSWHPPRQHEFLGLIGILAWTTGTAIGYGGDVAPMAGAMEGQRLFSCRNVREASKMYVWAEITLFLLLAVLTLPALGAMCKWPGLYDGSINKELAYGMLLGYYLPSGLLGLAVIALAASIMSTVDSNLNFGGQVFVNDVYRRFVVRKASDKHYINVARLVMCAILGLGILVATATENVIDIAIFMLGLSSAELTANWGQWWWWRFNGPARLAASFGGPLIFLLNKYVVFEYLIHVESSVHYVIVLSSIGMTLALWVAVALVTSPEPRDKLERFYRRTRPLGSWGPVADSAGLGLQGWVPITRGLGVAVLGLMMTASGTIALSSAYVGRWTIAFVSLLVCILAAASFKTGYAAHLRRIEPDLTP